MGGTDVSNFVVRQGDLLFVPIQTDELPPDLKKRENGIIAKGEATGHHHRVAVLEDADVLTAPEHFRIEPDVFLSVGPKGVSIVHEEHKTVTLDPNTFYKVNRAREYDYLADVGRFVSD